MSKWNRRQKSRARKGHWRNHVYNVLVAQGTSPTKANEQIDRMASKDRVQSAIADYYGVFGLPYPSAATTFTRNTKKP
jgi:hypothetical protein